MKNQSKNMIVLASKLKYKIIAKAFCLIGFVLGFNQQIIAQYGAPPASFRINGNINCSDTNYIKSKQTKIRIKESQNNHLLKENIAIKEDGSFQANIYDDYDAIINSYVTVSVYRLNSNNNQAAEETLKDTTFAIKNLNFTNDNYYNRTNKTPLNIDLPQCNQAAHIKTKIGNKE